MARRARHVIVAGGGPAGVAAAASAARVGARVTLVERYGFLGGMATTGLVHPWMPYFAGEKQLVAGIFQEVIDRLSAHDAFGAGWQLGHSSHCFDPEVLKRVLQEMLLQAGVQFRLHSFVAGARKRGSKVTGVVLESKSGREVLRGDVVVDCTGDGDVAAGAGAAFEKGRPEDGLMQPMTLHFRMARVDRSRMPSREEINLLYDAAKAAGRVQCPRENVLWFNTTREDEIHFNTTRVVEVDGTDVLDLTKAEIESRRQTWQIAEFLNREVPGFEQAYVCVTGPQVGVRETRRVMGEYVLSEEDVLGGKKFDDGVALSSYPVDIHNPRGEGTVLKHLPPGEWYSIPYRCLVPREVDGLLVAGRPISTTHEAHSSVRVQPTCYAMGQAAGIAAAMAAAGGMEPRAVDAQAVRVEIRSQGGILD
jgi:hypothetical protein